MACGSGRGLGTRSRVDLVHGFGVGPLERPWLDPWGESLQGPGSGAAIKLSPVWLAWAPGCLPVHPDRVFLCRPVGADFSAGSTTVMFHVDI